MPGDQAAAPPASKRKLSRKAHLKELAKQRRERHDDPEYQPGLEVEDVVEGGDQDEDEPVEQPGEASKRARAAYNQRRQRLRGLGSEAQFTANWLASAPENQQHFIDKAIAELALEVSRAAIAAAVRAVQDELQRELQAQAAAREAERRQQKREHARVATPEERSLRARVDVGTSPTSAAKSTQPRAGEERARMTDSAKASLARIFKQKHLRRDDVIGGDTLSRGEWESVRRDPKELQRLYALHTYVLARDNGLDWLA